jgi:hypothetical protein
LCTTVKANECEQLGAWYNVQCPCFRRTSHSPFWLINDPWYWNLSIAFTA